jgi:hypothetical protein
MAAPKGNNNAEVWTIEKATELFNKCLETAKDKELDCNDFIGEVAQENGTTLWQLDYLKGVFPELENTYKRIKSNCEANCFANGKKNKIVPSLAIMNLKSNHGWTDRVDNTTQGEKVNQSVLSNESISKLIDKL